MKRADPLSQCPECGAAVYAKPGGARPLPMAHGTVDGRVCPLIDRRPCDWCGGPMKENASPSAETCDDRCRAGRWKWRRGYGRRDRGPRSGRNARSGQQISYRKAVALLTAWIQRRDKQAGVLTAAARLAARREAELILRGALPARQAAQLRARENERLNDQEVTDGGR